tara:strand:+ start:792 stop:1748 length:957 start_codon:yes stop_codon:yes gene_type:complete
MKKIGLILGEPNSINSEILYKSWKKLKKVNKNKLLVIGSYSLLKAQFKRLSYRINLNLITDLEKKLDPKKINLIDVNLKFKDCFNIDKKEAKKYILKSLRLAYTLIKKSKISSFVNCSIDKKVFNKNIGVTEFISEISNKKNKGIMMIYNEKFSVVPLTNHMNIKNISKILSKKFIKDKIERLNLSYKSILKKKPKIAVLGLNPHLNELRNNSEEKKEIIPAIKELKRKKLNIYGPYSVDELFLNKPNKYDVIVGMYHDQVLGPFKALFGFNAINITLGLDFLRISPDHGTAKGIILKNKANSKSLQKAINFLLKLNG